jgi:hypothetical protein
MPSLDSLISGFAKTRIWFLRNEDTGDVLEGQYAPEGLTLNIQNNYARHTSLNRSKVITQYLNGSADQVSFQGQFFAETMVDFNQVEKKTQMLIDMARRDPDLGRPPIVTFWVGNSFLEQQSTIDSLNLGFGRPAITGDLKDLVFSITLSRYDEYSLKDNEIFETRYHRTRAGEYFELMAQREYGNALIGDVIRKRHPTKPNPGPGEVIKLPSIEAIRADRVQPSSAALDTAYDRKDTAQRRNRIDLFRKRNVATWSHIIKAG